MSFTSDLSSEERDSHANALLREVFYAMPALDQTLALSDDPKHYEAALGEDFQTFTGLNRLSTLRILRILEPLDDPLETLIACNHKATRAGNAIKAHFPHFDKDTWISKPTLFGARQPGFELLNTHQQLATYQLAAWNTSAVVWNLTNLLKPSWKKHWDAVPAFIQEDPTFQQILALRCPGMFQEVLKSQPDLTWNPYACALSFKALGLPPDVSWCKLLDNDTFAQLMDHRAVHHPLHQRHDHYVYGFTPDKLPTLLDVHPGLFVQGAMRSAHLRDSAMAQRWFTPMLEAMFKKCMDVPTYASTLITTMNEVYDGHAQLLSTLEQLAPDYARTLHVHNTLLPPHESYAAWLNSNASMLRTSVPSYPLPEMEL